MKTAIALICLMVLIPFSSAVDITPASAKTSVSVSSGSSSGKVVSSSSSGGSQFLTEYGWDGTKCVKKDILSLPYLTRADSKFNPNFKAFKERIILDKPAKEGYVWAVLVLNGNNGVAYDKVTKKVIKEPVCDTSFIDTKPLDTKWLK